MNVKRAVATAAGAFGALLLAAVVSLGHFAGHSSGAGIQTRAAVTHTAPVKATLDRLIYGDSVDAPSTTAASTSSTSTYGSDGSVTPATDGSSIYGDGTSSIYGDGSSIYGDGSSIYGDNSGSIYGDGSSIYGDSGAGTTSSIYGD